MDPLHPIIPSPPPIRPVTPAPRVRATARDGGQGSSGAGGGRRRRAQDDPPPEPAEGELAEAADGDDGHPHVDIIA